MTRWRTFLAWRERRERAKRARLAETLMRRAVNVHLPTRENISAKDPNVRGRDAR